MKEQRRETIEKEGERERQMRRETESEEEKRKRRVRIIERAERSFLSSSSPSDTDIISSLPDCLLTHILSLLPTRDAIATTILSSRWSRLWTLVPILDLDHRQLFNNEKTFSFVDTVSNIFTLHTSKAIPLLKLRINWCRKCEPFYVHKWVQQAILPGRLQELDVHIFSCGQLMELPPGLFFCSTLVVLKLDGNNLLLNPPASAFRFPSLRILLLKWVSYANNDSLPTLLAACPVLQDLTLTMCRDVFKRTNKNAGKFNVIVLVPTLKRFAINTTLSSYAPYKLLINTPALEYFHFKGVLDENIVLESLPNLVKSFLQVKKHRVLTSKDYAKRIWDFMGQLYNAISMELSIETAEILYHASNDDVPIFHNLSSLKLYSLYSPKRYTWHVVQLLLCQAPKLQILSFEFKHCNYYTPIGYMEEALHLPEYKSAYFTTCHYEGFQGLDEEMKLVKQILKAASVLKTLTIVVDSHLGTMEEHHVLKRLWEFPKSSQICKIAFD